MEAIITPVPWTVQGRGVSMVTVYAHECVSVMLLASHSTWPEWILTLGAPTLSVDDGETSLLT